MDNKKNRISVFLEKFKDKKYRSKVEFIGYGIFILLLIMYLNVANSNHIVSNTVIPNRVDADNDKKDINLLDGIINNYNYDIKISYEKDSNSYEEEYYGKVSLDNIIINKKFNNVVSTFYKVSDEYYEKKENEDYHIIDEDDVYELLDNKYIELDGLKKYINMASLDHVTDYSSGKREEVYHLRVSDVIKSYKEDSLIDFNVSIENGIISIKADYSNLLSVMDDNIKSCNVLYTYTDIDKVEKFSIMDDLNN